MADGRGATVRVGPAGLVEAVALLADGRTAVALIERAGLQEGETVLVEAAAGGVGSLLVQLAESAGGRVVAAAGGLVVAPGGAPLVYGRISQRFRIPAFIAWGDSSAAAELER